MNNKRRKALEKTLKIYRKIVAIIFIILFMRLGWLQIIEADIYQTRAEDNRMRLVTIPHTREIL